MTHPISLPDSLEAIFNRDQPPEALFTAILPALCDVLKTDRCFLHVRQPAERLYRNFCWRRRPDFPDTSTNGWQLEDPWEQEDPMFAAALRCAAPIFVEDIETAGPEVLNVEFERNNLGHRSLVHAHICQDGVLYGILQPCLFGHPRVWSDSDRSVISQMLERLKPYVLQYVEAATGS
jgi:GAF domain-containing protein